MKRSIGAPITVAIKPAQAPSKEAKNERLLISLRSEEHTSELRHANIYTLSLHDALPISYQGDGFTHRCLDVFEIGDFPDFGPLLRPAAGLHGVENETEHRRADHRCNQAGAGP